MITAQPAILSNGLVRAVVHLPDPVHGFHRGTRFDWAGIISSLTACGHEFFGPWRDLHDPLQHDCITGLAEEFQSFPEPDVDFPFAEPGGIFLRLGVGLLRRPATGDAATSFKRFHTYELVGPSLWTVSAEPAALHLRHEARSPSGVAAIYRKTLRLQQDSTTLILEHSLENIGNRPIHTHHYNHNFFRIEGGPPGDSMLLSLPFPVRFPAGRPDLLSVVTQQAPGQHTALSLARTLQPGESILTDLTGFEPQGSPYAMHLLHRATGASVRIQADRPLARLLFWATPKTFCPEPYIALSVAPGEQTSWSLRYTFGHNPVPPAPAC